MKIIKMFESGKTRFLLKSTLANVKIFLQDAYGVTMESFYRIPMRFLKDPYGFLVGLLWNPYRMPMGALYDPYRRPMGSYGVLIEPL